jgi:hypothetical protein
LRISVRDTFELLRIISAVLFRFGFFLAIQVEPLSGGDDPEILWFSEFEIGISVQH